MRLKIMERDGFACRKCAAKDKTLHVHHHYYTKGAEPWEYDDEVFVTLCDDCHGQIEKASQQMKLAVGNLMVSNVCSLKCAVEAIAFMGNVRRHYFSVEQFNDGFSFLKHIGACAVSEKVRDNERSEIFGEIFEVDDVDEFKLRLFKALKSSQLCRLNGRKVDV